jgi:methionyl-tRNA formyltransferase
VRLLLFGDGIPATNSLRRLAQEGWELSGLVAEVEPSDRTLVSVAQELGLPILQPRRVNDADVVTTLAALKPALSICISYLQIVRRPLLDIAPLGFVNLHPGKLPEYRGRHAISWAIVNGEDEIGVTAHFMDEGVDTGDVIRQRIIPVGWTDTYGDVKSKLNLMVPELVAEVAKLVAAGCVARQPQRHELARYFCPRREGDEAIAWADASRALHNKIRAFSRPGPGAKTTLGTRPVTIWRAFYDPAWPQYVATPGEVVARRPGEGVVVKTGDSTLLLLEVQIQDEEATTPAWPIGTRLGIDVTAQLPGLLAQVERQQRELEALKRQLLDPGASGAARC